MPELWLPYGDVEVLLALKAENLGNIHPAPTPQQQTGIEEFKATIDPLSSGPVIVVMPDLSETCLQTLAKVLETLHSSGADLSNVTIVDPHEPHAKLRKILESYPVKRSSWQDEIIEVGSIEGVTVKIPRQVVESKNVLIISEGRFDPLFGFSGGHNSLINTFLPDLKLLALKTRVTGGPSEGDGAISSSIPAKLADLLPKMVSIEAITWGRNYAEYYYGDVVDTHTKVKNRLISLGTLILKDRPRGVVASAGGGPFDQNLALALRALWNVAGSIRPGGICILLAECRGGLGSRALDQYASGQVTLEALSRGSQYLDGAEDLLFLAEVVKTLKIVLISSLPNYYVETVLGLKAAKRLRDAVQYALSSGGSRMKLDVVYNASTTVVKVR